MFGSFTQALSRDNLENFLKEKKDNKIKETKPRFLLKNNHNNRNNF